MPAYSTDSGFIGSGSAYSSADDGKTATNKASAPTRRLLMLPKAIASKPTTTAKASINAAAANALKDAFGQERANVQSRGQDQPSIVYETVCVKGASTIPLQTTSARATGIQRTRRQRKALSTSRGRRLPLSPQHHDGAQVSVLASNRMAAVGRPAKCGIRRLSVDGKYRGRHNAGGLWQCHDKR